MIHYHLIMKGRGREKMKLIWACAAPTLGFIIAASKMKNEEC